MCGRVTLCAVLAALYYLAGVRFLPTWTTRLALEQFSDSPHASSRLLDLQTAWDLGWIVVIALCIHVMRDARKGRNDL